MEYHEEHIVKDDDGNVIARGHASVELHTDEFGVVLFVAACVGAGIYHLFFG